MRKSLPKVGEVAIDEDGEEYIVKPINATCHAFFHSECINKDIECYRCDEFYLKNNENERTKRN